MREELLKALNYAAPNGGGPTVEDLHAAVESSRTDNLVRLMTAEQAMEEWYAEQAEYRPRVPGWLFWTLDVGAWAVIIAAWRAWG